MELLICGGCEGTVPEVLASPHWHPARVLSNLDVGDGLGGILVFREPLQECSKAYQVSNYKLVCGMGSDATQVQKVS